MTTLAGVDVRTPGRPVPRHVLATMDALPPGFLDDILRSLRIGGLVRSQRGGGGGWALARPAASITVADVVRALEGPLATVRGIRPHELPAAGDAEPFVTLWIAVRGRAAVGARRGHDRRSVARLAAAHGGGLGGAARLLDEPAGQPVRLIPTCLVGITVLESHGMPDLPPFPIATAVTTDSIEVRPLSGWTGAEIVGVDLRVAARRRHGRRHPSGAAAVEGRVLPRPARSTTRPQIGFGRAFGDVTPGHPYEGDVAPAGFPRDPHRLAQGLRRALRPHLPRTGGASTARAGTPTSRR